MPENRFDPVPLLLKLCEGDGCCYPYGGRSDEDCPHYVPDPCTGEIKERVGCDDYISDCDKPCEWDEDGGAMEYELCPYKAEHQAWEDQDECGCINVTEDDWRRVLGLVPESPGEFSWNWQDEQDMPAINGEPD